MNIPIATYRLQLNHTFTFSDAERILPYLSALGISDVYVSPILQAQTNSSHGYDTIDHAQINQDLGGEHGFKHFTKRLRDYHLNLLVDIVPNHMAATQQNKDWNELVLRRKNATHGYMFDVNWSLSTDDLLVYRRFFDVNELVCLRVEDERVFHKTHHLILKLIHEGHIQGLRIDHIDGLRDPVGYLKALSSHIKAPFYIVVEKILSFDESPPREWPIAETTGYDFTNRLNQLFLYKKGLSELVAFYEKITGNTKSLQRIRIDSIEVMIKKSFQREFNYLSNQLHAIIGGTLTAVESLLMQFSSNIVRYRLYANQDIVDEEGTKIIQDVGRDLDVPDRQLLTKLTDLLLLHFPDNLSKTQKAAWRQWHNDWEVFTGPIMAKGFEDTAGYAYNPLLSLNEVGSGPEYDVAAGAQTHFHGFNINKQQQFPYGLNTTSTHDTKRSEDVRARLNVLTECSDEWNNILSQWLTQNIHKKTILNNRPSPDITDELLIYQTLLGAWPLDNNLVSLKTRLAIFLTKAMRERKEHSSWDNPNILYEKATIHFLNALLIDRRFIAHFLLFQQKIAFYGMYNALAQVVLKITCPGIPDFYQGNETWRFDLVDPDNRQKIDYTVLNKLTSDEPLSDLLNEWQTGQIKFNLMKRLLHLRTNNNAIFLLGDYIPLDVQGQYADHITAFARTYQNEWIIVITVRWLSRIIPSDSPWSTAHIPNGDCIILPETLQNMRSLIDQQKNVFTGNTLSLKDVLRDLPFNLLRTGPT